MSEPQLPAARTLPTTECGEMKPKRRYTMKTPRYSVSRKKFTPEEQKAKARVRARKSAERKAAKLNPMDAYEKNDAVYGEEKAW